MASQEWVAVSERLESVRRRIETACEIAGRDPATVTLVAISKRHPEERIRAAAAAGQRVFGENLVQEGMAKVESLAELSAGLDEPLEWHLVGPLQSNKVKKAVATFDVLHAVDRAKIARKVGKECLEQGRRVPAFVQVNVGAEESKHGFPVDRFEEKVRPLVGIDGFEILGLMTIPPFEEDPDEARRWFRRLRELRDQTREWPEWSEVPGLLSMGMSHDFEMAIEEGATHVRVGTDVFGPRPA